MSDQGSDTPGTPPSTPPQWGQQPPPPQPDQQWGQQPPAPQQGQPWGQQPPPAQQGQQWGQPPATQPGQQWGQQPQSSGGGGLEPNVASMLAYLLFGWIGGLIMYLTQKHPEVRFHGAQSILLFAPLSIIQFILSFFIGGLTSLFLISALSGLVGLFSFVMWIYMSIQGYQMNHVKLPIIGDMAEQWAAKPA